MNKYFMMRDGTVTGPFSTQELSRMVLLFTDHFALDSEKLIWLSAIEIPELSQLHIRPETLASQLHLPDSSTKKPARTGFRRMFSETEFRIYFKNFLNKIQTARVAALFVLMLTATLFIKATLDIIVVNNFSYMQTAMIPAPRASKITEGKNFRNAIVKKYIDPALSSKTYHKPAKPSEVFKQVRVKGKSFQAHAPHPRLLLITVTNHSHYMVDNAEVEVIYETGGKPFIEKYQFTYLSPLGSKTMSVPMTWQNVKVDYRVLNIYTSQYTALQKEV